LASLLLSLALPLGRRAVDRWTVRAVRDQALAALHRTRMEARLLGGAVLEVDGGRGVLTARAADSVLWTRHDAGEAGVTIQLPGGGERTSVTFDGLGLGVVASRTLVFRRGGEEARLVISSRGRGARR
ncbi:MAG: hypothetical protein RQ751_14390, partial [Longimicrobiales bacterium]|nr:hypothetical protein [Longimicrobiales bacterium]